MRVKTLFIVIVLNVFLMLFASVMLEYVNLATKFSSLENTFQVALDSAIRTATGSEELFSDKFNERMTSRSSRDATVGESKDITAFSTTLLWRGNGFRQINSYALAMFYAVNHRLPESYTEINSINSLLSSSNQTAHIFNWLYGEATPDGNEVKLESDYNNVALNWADTNQSVSEDYNSSGINNRNTDTSRSMFKDYYENVGKYQKTTGYLKRHEDDTYELEMCNYATLLNMGFKWMEDDGATGSDSGNITVSADVNSDFTADNLVSTVKVGKREGSAKRSFYFLTPASLGVTYVPVEVLKPVMMANLDTLVRLNKLSSGAGVDSEHSLADTLNDADKCIETSVFDDGVHNTDHVLGTNADGSPEKIVQDGNVEYDLNSLKVKVDYFYVDFGETTDSTKTLISKLNGCISYAEAHDYPGNTVYYPNELAAGIDNSEYKLKGLTLQRFQEADSSALATTGDNYSGMYNQVRNGRIIARVSAKIKVHIPYQSSVMQWVCQKIYNKYPDLVPASHYDVKLFDPDAKGGQGGIYDNSNGVWYQYTTYYMQTRT